VGGHEMVRGLLGSRGGRILLELGPRCMSRGGGSSVLIVETGVWRLGGLYGLHGAVYLQKPVYTIFIEVI
jgi:hypothetical protein